MRTSDKRKQKERPTRSVTKKERKFIINSINLNIEVVHTARKKNALFSSNTISRDRKYFLSFCDFL